MFNWPTFCVSSVFLDRAQKRIIFLFDFSLRCGSVFHLFVVKYISSVWCTILCSDLLFSPHLPLWQIRLRLDIWLLWTMSSSPSNKHFPKVGQYSEASPKTIWKHERVLCNQEEKWFRGRTSCFSLKDKFWRKSQDFVDICLSCYGFTCIIYDWEVRE